MRILLSTYGSRGDVEPLVALGAALIAMGHEATVSTPPDQEFVDLLDRAGVPIAPAFMSVRQWIAEKARPSKPAEFSTLAAEVMAGQYAAIGEAAKGCDVIVATGLFPSAAAAQAVAETQGIRFVQANYCPLFLPSMHHDPSPWPGRPLPEGVTDRRILWAHNAETMTLLFGGALNDLRASVGLPTTDNVRDYTRGHSPLLASDPVLWPWQTTDLSDPVQTGAWILPDNRPLAPDVIAFLEAGEPPVYAGFGSMQIHGTAEPARAVIEAIRAQGRRTLLARGWADLGLIDDNPDCFITGDVNQQALFPRVAAVIHHGGAGTTTAAARAGAPQVIVPQVADQPYWAQRVAALGIGAAHQGPNPTFESISAALKTALAPETRAKAVAIASTIRTDGAEVAANLLVEMVGR
jgi:vancomycin aglycone glucosyltransferase